MKKWIILASLLCGSVSFAQNVDSMAVDIDGKITEGNKKVKKEIVTEFRKEIETLKQSQKKSDEEVKFQVKELEAKMKKEIEVSEKAKMQEEADKESKLKISGITFIRSRTELTNTETGNKQTETLDHYWIALAQVNFEKQVSDVVKANLRIATDGSSNLVKLGGDSESQTPTRPNIVVDHAYMTVETGLATNKVGMIAQKTSIAKDLYFASVMVGNDSYKNTGAYADDLRGTLIGLRSELSFYKGMGLNLTVAKYAEDGKNSTTEVDGIISDETETFDLYTLDAEIPMSFGKISLVPEGLIGLKDSVSYITAGMDISMPVGPVKLSICGAGNFDRILDKKNGTVSVSGSTTAYKSKDVTLAPSLGYTATGETQSGFAAEELLTQHYIDLKLPTTYKKFTLRPRWRTYICPNEDVKALGGGSFYQKMRYECDFIVKF